MLYVIRSRTSYMHIVKQARIWESIKNNDLLREILFFLSISARQSLRRYFLQTFSLFRHFGPGRRADQVRSTNMYAYEYTRSAVVYWTNMVAQPGATRLPTRTSACYTANARCRCVRVCI